MTETYSYIFESVDLVQRDDDGCVSNCPTLPDCVCSNKNEECVQVPQTCEKCAYNRCTTKDSTSTLNTGAIVGGAIGGAVFIALLAALYYYFRVYKKRPPVLLDDEYDYSYHDDDTDGFVSDKGGGYALQSLESAGANNSVTNLSNQPSPTESHFSGAGKQDGNPNNSTSSPTHAQFGSKDAVASSAGQNGAQIGSNGAAAGSAALERPPMRRVLSGEARAKAKRRISSYESFTRPNALKSKSKQQQQLAAQQRRARQQKIVKQANLQQQQQQQQQQQPQQNLQPHQQIYSNHSHRSSVATSISNASNILPIAYIPGVTVRPSKNNTGSLYSYDSESLFSDLNTIENASIVGDNVVASHGQGQAVGAAPGGSNGNGASANGNSATMTAIKAQPKLVNVDKIEEEEEEDDEEEEDWNREADDSFDIVPHPGYGTKSMRYDSDDSDVDSDIGQITRATSVKKLNKKNPSRSDVEGTTVISSDHTSNSLPHNREILMNSESSSNMSHIPAEMMNYNETDDSNRDAGSTVGSFLFDIGFDDNSASSPSQSNMAFDESNRKGSPFADGSV
ncbi:hypothetical protein CANMA_002094 [Candida margitis]|uniref:uncharacterized protein n=1 Tax=Candida margitis TaxID=1775924 RepID=UPI002226611B|nr:uncharacterized protein CANMA_002094 [Candida margitis]KAI5968659.1 hypothetical protein CANMA_002094 [Candida margitis]